MTAMHFELADASVAVASFRTASKTADAQMGKLVRHYGQLLRTRVMANASGRPGPRSITGDYRRSWVHEHRGGGGLATSTVGTNAVQARRLENGFHGMDSLGRVYSQPPFPHARPAFDQTAPEFERAGSDLLGRLLR